jgi:ankyrin repeat protein
VLRYLVEKGVDLNSVVSGERCTPLQHAAEKGNRRIIDLLLELGADIDGQEGKDGFTIHYALMSGNESIVRHVLDKGAVISDSNTARGSIVRAIKHKLTGLIPLLLEKGADLNPPSPSRSPAAEAFENAPKEIFKMLMDHGAAFGNDFYTLEHTIKRRPLKDLKELLEYGVDPNIPGDWKQAVTVSHSNNINRTLIEKIWEIKQLGSGSC